MPGNFFLIVSDHHLVRVTMISNSALQGVLFSEHIKKPNVWDVLNRDFIHHRHGLVHISGCLYLS